MDLWEFCSQARTRSFQATWAANFLTIIADPKGFGFIPMQATTTSIDPIQQSGKKSSRSGTIRLVPRCRCCETGDSRTEHGQPCPPVSEHLDETLRTRLSALHSRF